MNDTSGAEGHAPIFSHEKSKITTPCWTTVNRRMLDPTKKRYSTSKGKGEAPTRWSVQFSSVAQSCPTLRPHESQHTRPPCPSPTPRVHPNPCPLSRQYLPTISSSVIPIASCPQSFPVQQAEWQIPRPTQSEIVVVPGPTYGPQDSWSSALITPSWLLAVQKFGESKMYREKLGYNCGRRGRM